MWWTYRVIQEESAILWEKIVCVILSKKVQMNMGLIFDGYGVMTAWNSAYEKITYSTHSTIYRVIQEESAILWEMIVCVILSKKVHMNMGPILDG